MGIFTSDYSLTTILYDLEAQLFDLGIYIPLDKIKHYYVNEIWSTPDDLLMLIIDKEEPIV